MAGRPAVSLPLEGRLRLLFSAYSKSACLSGELPAGEIYLLPQICLIQEYRHYEATDQDYDLGDTGTTLSGLSVGLLSAAAVAISTSISDLAHYGVDSVRIAFRMGIHVDRVSQSLEAREPDSNPKTWAYVVTGVSAETVQQELDRFNKETVTILLFRKRQNTKISQND